MAKIITLAETSPGNFQVQGMGDTGGNPFAMTPTGGNQPPQASYQAKLPNGVVINFASEADYLKADQYMRSVVAQGAAPTIGGGVPTLGGGNGSMNFLRTGAEAAETVVGYLQGRAYDRKISDLDDSLDELDGAINELNALATNPKYTELIPPLLRALRAERDATSTAQAALEDSISAVDIKTGAGAAKVVSQFLNGNGNGTGSGSNTATVAAVGLGGFGLGALLSRDDRRSRRRR
jgi:hypothetical protein